MEIPPMKSCKNRALMINPDTNARWIPCDEAQALVNLHRPLATGFVNPEGVYEDELNAYLRGELDQCFIDETVVWRQESPDAPPDGNAVTEALHYELFDSPNAKYDIETMPIGEFDLSDKTTRLFLSSAFFDSQRKGIYIPSLYVGWHITIMPYAPGVTPRKLLEYLNACDWNRDVTKVTRFKYKNHIDFSSIVERDFFLRMTPIQQERICSATVIAFKSEALDLYKQMEKDAKRKRKKFYSSPWR